MVKCKKVEKYLATDYSSSCGHHPDDEDNLIMFERTSF